MSFQLDHYRLLGRSGLRVSPLSLGTMTFGVDPAGWGSSEEDARRMIDLYMERGGNFIDTANFYAQGESEKMLGRLVQGRRERLVISTKYSLTMRKGDANATGNSRKNMVRAVEESLKRLGTDYIDLFYLHVWDFRTPIEEILRGLDDLTRQGKIVYAGISDTPAWQVARMQMAAELRGWTPFVAMQMLYNLVDRTAERDLIPMAQEVGIGVIPWSPLAGGVLSGKYSRADLEAPKTSLGGMTDRKGINAATGRLSERGLDIAETVVEMAKELNVKPASVALAWTLLNQAVASTLIGARTFAQFESNLEALDVKFSDEQIARLDAVSRPELGFPHDMLRGPSYEFMFGNIEVQRRG
jgi:aryl-alcohol dehydrogenase-like predicted oxidoreductase